MSGCSCFVKEVRNERRRIKDCFKASEGRDRRLLESETGLPPVWTRDRLHAGTLLFAWASLMLLGCWLQREVAADKEGQTSENRFWGT